MRELVGRVAVVTGAAGGIGAAIARRLHAEGCKLVLVDLAREPMLELARALDASAHGMDVADASAWTALATEVRAEFGPAQILVNNAGLTIHGTFANQTLADLDRIVDVNVKGVLYGTRAFLSQLTARGEGHVVNISSLAGRVAFPYQSTYSATKFAVRGFSAALRMELAPLGVGVTAVLPGTVATRLLEAARSYDPTTSRKLSELMLAHGLRPERVAERVVTAIRRDEAEVVAGWDAWLATATDRIAPRAIPAALGAAFRWHARRNGREHEGPLR